MRVVLVTGKGGVGKTTLASATALAAASRGYRTLLVSTDAAHSLADVLLQRLDAEPIRITANLDGLQLDARHEMHRSWSTISTYIKRLVGLTEIDQLRIDELVVIPGLDQLVALARLQSLASEGRWDAMVVDCAPSADSLRLLSLPDVLGWYLDRLFGQQGPFARWGRKRVERTFALPMPDESVLTSIRNMADELSRLRDVLSDSTTSARVVVTPERVVIAEAQRTMAYLALYGYAVDAVLVNRVPSSDPTLPESLLTDSRRQLTAIDDTFATLPRLKVCLQPAEPLGIEILTEIGHALYRDTDPVARLSSSPAMQISSEGNESTVRLFVPGARREEIELELDGDDLVVTLGAHRRTVKLPDGLSGRPVTRAGLRDEHLEVVFGEAVDA